MCPVDEEKIKIQEPLPDGCYLTNELLIEDQNSEYWHIDSESRHNVSQIYTRKVEEMSIVRTVNHIH